METGQNASLQNAERRGEAKIAYGQTGILPDGGRGKSRDLNRFFIRAAIGQIPDGQAPDAAAHERDPAFGPRPDQLRLFVRRVVENGYLVGGKQRKPQMARHQVLRPHGKPQLSYSKASLRPLDDRAGQAEGIRQISLDGFRPDVHFREARNGFQQFFSTRLGAKKPARGREKDRRHAQNDDEDEIFQHALQNSNPTVK